MDISEKYLSFESEYKKNNLRGTNYIRARLPVHFKWNSRYILPVSPMSSSEATVNIDIAQLGERGTELFYLSCIRLHLFIKKNV